MTAASRARAVVLVAAAAALVLSGCGLPQGGTVRRVESDTVPYRLLESSAPAEPPLSHQDRPVQAPLVVWGVGERLLPEAAGVACAEPVEDLVERLLSVLAAGPSEEARAAGRYSAFPPDSELELVGIADGTVEVGIDPELAVSAERLPMAVGQVVLSVTSAPTVDAVVLLDEGEPVQVPLPTGALTAAPVTAADYAELLPRRLRAPGRIGCATA